MDSKNDVSTSFYSKLPEHYFAQAEAKPIQSSFRNSSAASRLISDYSQNSEIADKILTAKLEGKSFILDNPDKKRKPKLKSVSFKKIPWKIRKSLRKIKLSPQEKRFELYSDLHAMWNEYMKDLWANTKNPTDFLPSLLKADLNGAFINVIKNKSPSSPFVGCCGIVLQETMNTFRIITEKDSFICIPKKNNIFELKLFNDISFLLFGSQICYRGEERASRKFKSKPFIL